MGKNITSHTSIPLVHSDRAHTTPPPFNTFKISLLTKFRNKMPCKTKKFLKILQNYLQGHPNYTTFALKTLIHTYNSNDRLKKWEKPSLMTQLRS